MRPLLKVFYLQYPELEIEMSFDDTFMDCIAQRFEFSRIFGLGQLKIADLLRNNSVVWISLPVRLLSLLISWKDH